jgi:translation initiation factor IF-1
LRSPLYDTANTKVEVERGGICRGARNGKELVARDDLIQIQGRVVEALAGGHFRVEDDQGHSFLARISGRLRRFHIKVVPGDRVTIAVSPYDLTHGFIIYRSS